MSDHPIATGMPGSWSRLEEHLQLTLAVATHQHAQTEREAARRTRRDRRSDSHGPHLDPRAPTEQRPPRCRETLRIEVHPPPTRWTLDPDYLDQLHNQQRHRAPGPGPDDPPPF